jgi:diaminopropionate ammonia-lyase
VVEPAEADCLFESALVARAASSKGSLDTSMSCLACREPSTLAWRILGSGADAFLTIPDYAAEETVRLLASPAEGDPRVLSQPSGVAGLTGVIAALFEPTLSEPLGLDSGSRVLVVVSEGPAPDPASDE